MHGAYTRLDASFFRDATGPCSHLIGQPYPTTEHFAFVPRNGDSFPRILHSTLAVECDDHRHPELVFPLCVALWIPSSRFNTNTFLRVTIHHSTLATL